MRRTPIERSALRLIVAANREYGSLPAGRADDVLDLDADQVVAHDERFAAGSGALDALAGAVVSTEEAVRRVRSAATHLEATAGGLSLDDLREQAIIVVVQLRDLLRSIRSGG